jgi:hypothetical protein
VLVGRPHLVGITALQSNTSCLLRETNSGEIRYNNVLGTSGKEILVTVKGGFTVTSSAIENLAVTIDGQSYNTPELIGRQTASFEDVATVPPAQPPLPAKGAPSKAPAAKAPAKAPARGR